MNSRKAIDAVVGIALVSLAGVSLSQYRHISTLDSEVSTLKAQVAATTKSHRLAVEPIPDAKLPVDAPTAADQHKNVVQRVERRDGNDTTKTTATEALNVDSPEVRLKLRDVIAEEQEVLRQERRANRIERRENQIQENVQKLAADAHLDDATALKISDLLMIELAEASETFRKAREQGTWREAWDAATALREETDAEAKTLLSEDQYEFYSTMRQEEMPGRGPRGRGRGR